MSAARIDKIAVLGGGAWGTALAHAAALAGRDVMVWARDGSVVEAINGSHENPAYLPGTILHKNVRATRQLSCVAQANAVLLVTPAQTTAMMARQLVGQVTDGQPVILCAKGLDQATGQLLSDVLVEALPRSVPAVLSGPSFAVDVAGGLPTAVTVAAGSEEVAFAIARSLSGPTFRPYASSDPVGVQIGGALKNVLAIACGIVEGRSLGASARAALTARGFAELQRLGLAMGAKPETLTGLSGLGDLVLTCSSRKSRNFSFGISLGEGRSMAELTAPGCKLVEGIFSASIAVRFAERYGLDLPICRAVTDVLAGQREIDAAIAALMARPLRREDC